MSPLAAFWIASFFGAAVFAAAGYFAARVALARDAWRFSGSNVEPGWLSLADDDDRGGRGALSVAGGAPASSGPCAGCAALSATRAELASVTVSLDSARTALAEAHEALEAARVELAIVGKKATKLTGENVELRGDASEKRAKIEQIDADLVSALRKLSAKEENAKKAESALTDARQSLADAGRKVGQIEQLRGADEQRRDLALRVQVLERKLVDADALRDENAKLRTAVRDRDHWKAKVVELERRLLDSVALEATKEWTLDQLPSKGATHPKVSGSRRRLQDLVVRIARLDAVRAVTLADDLGFPVETSGDHAEALAALSGLLATTAAKARELVPFAAPRRITLVDENEVTITAHRYASDYGPLALVVLTQGPCPDWESSS